MPEDAVIDAPVEEKAVDTAPEIGGTDTATDQGTDTAAETDSGESLRGSALWREVKSLTQEGKPLTPKQLSALNKAIHKANAIETKYPDGLTAIEQRMEALKPLIDDESIPFEQAIQQTIEERTYYRDLDKAFSEGKPEFVEKLAEASPEAFQNIAPSVFRKYAEVNPEGYSTYVAQAVVQHMNSAEIPLQFRILDSFLPQIPDGPAKEQVLSAIRAVYEWSEGLRGMAAKKIEAKALPGSATAPQGDDLAAQNEQLKTENSRIQWNQSVREEGVSFVMAEAAKAEAAALAGKTRLSEAEKQKVLKLVGEEMDARLSADKTYAKAMQGYLKAGNRASYLQRIQSERKKLVPGATRRAVDDVIAARPKNAPKAAPQQATKQAPAKPLAGAPQFRKIAGPPKTLGMQVDLGKTSHTMLANRQAVLTDGSRVSWGK